MTPGEVRLRRAGLEDAEGMAEVKVETWRAAYAGILPAALLDGLSVPAERAQWRSSLRSFDADFRVAVQGGRVVGYAVSGPALEGPAELGELYAIYLRPAQWGAGVGRRLMDRALEDLRVRGKREVVLWVFEANLRTRRFYEAAGYALDGGRREELGQPTLRYRRPLR